MPDAITGTFPRDHTMVFVSTVHNFIVQDIHHPTHVYHHAPSSLTRQSVKAQNLPDQLHWLLNNFV